MLRAYSDGKKLFNVGRKIAGQKPVIIYKAGKNQSIARVTRVTHRFHSR